MGCFCNAFAQTSLLNVTKLHTGKKPKIALTSSAVGPTEEYFFSTEEYFQKLLFTVKNIFQKPERTLNQRGTMIFLVLCSYRWNKV